MRFGISRFSALLIGWAIRSSIASEHVPRERGAARDVARGPPSEEQLDMFRRQAVAGPDRAQVLRSEGVAGLDVCDDVERAAELERLLLRADRTVGDLAERLPRAPGFRHKLGELGRLHGERGVDAAVG